MDWVTQLRGMEGKENIAYPDPVTKGDPWTIGIGHTGPEVFEGLVWSDELIEEVFKTDCGDVVFEVFSNFPWVKRLNPARQGVILNMCFQMGIKRLSGFKKFLRAAEDERWPQAAGEMLDSKWAKQTSLRARRLARQMETGDWQ